MSNIGSGNWTQKPPIGTPLAPPPLPLGQTDATPFASPLRPWMVAPLNESGGRPVRDVVTRQYGHRAPSTSWTTTRDGNAVKMTANVNDNVAMVNIPKLPTIATHGFTVEAIFTLRILRDYNGIVSRTSAGTAGPFDWWCSAANMQFHVGNGTNHTNWIYTNPAAGVRHHILFSVGLNAAGSLWQIQALQDGVALATNTVGVIQPIADVGDTIYCGNRADSVTALDGSIAFAAVWSGAMSLQQMRHRYLNPWAIFDASAIGLTVPVGTTPPPPLSSFNWRFMQPNMGVFAEYLAATSSRLSSLRVEYPYRAVVLKDGMADTALQWFIANTPPALRWSW